MAVRLFLIPLVCSYLALTIEGSDGASSPGGNGNPNPGLPGLFASISEQTFWKSPVSLYSAVGFKTSSSVEGQLENTKAFVGHPATKLYPASTPGYRIVHLASTSGAELWGGANADNCFFGNDPHFAGPSRLCMELTEKHEHKHDEGSLFGNAMTPGSLEEEWEEDFLMSCQFGFSCPTYHLCGKELELPTRMTVQVAAFASKEIKIFDSLSDYEKFNQQQQEKDKDLITFADQSFGSLSLCNNENTNKDEFRRNIESAVFTGHVVRAELKTNELTGESFYWALVETHGGCQFDVVIHPLFLENQPTPRPGSIIQGAFWLSGRLLPEEDI